MNNEVTKKSLWITTIVTILIGFIFVVFRANILDFLSYIIGAIIIVMGAISVIVYFRNYGKSTTGYSFGFAVGLVMIVFGIYLLVDTKFILQILVVFFGFYILTNGIVGLQLVLESLRAKNSKWKVAAIVAAINTILGVLVLINPFGAMEVLIVYVGAFLMITGLLNIGSLVFAKKLENK